MLDCDCSARFKEFHGQAHFGAIDAHSRADALRPVELIDFRTARDSRSFSFSDRLSHGDIHISRGQLSPNEGSLIGAAQPTLAIHLGDAFDMEWCAPGSDRLQTTRVEPGHIHINPGDTPFYQRWTSYPRLLVIAFDQAMISAIAEEIFGTPLVTLRTEVGIADPAITAAIPIWLREMDHGCPGRALFVESLANATAVHLLRNYSSHCVGPALMPIKGGLGAQRLRRVSDYIEAHIDTDLSVARLAHIVGLRPHHFGQAFRATVGISPHRYVVARRIERAKALLLSTRMGITEVALAVGFASHSHFASNFRRAIGIPPSRFRIERT